MSCPSSLLAIYRSYLFLACSWSPSALRPVNDFHLFTVVLLSASPCLYTFTPLACTWSPSNCHPVNDFRSFTVVILHALPCLDTIPPMQTLDHLHAHRPLDCWGYIPCMTSAHSPLCTSCFHSFPLAPDHFYLTPREWILLIHCGDPSCLALPIQCPQLPYPDHLHVHRKLVCWWYIPWMTSAHSSLCNSCFHYALPHHHDCIPHDTLLIVCASHPTRHTREPSTHTYHTYRMTNHHLLSLYQTHLLHRHWLPLSGYCIPPTVDSYTGLDSSHLTLSLTTHRLNINTIGTTHTNHNLGQDLSCTLFIRTCVSSNYYQLINIRWIICIPMWPIYIYM